jgi:hypothetical protein
VDPHYFEEFAVYLIPAVLLLLGCITEKLIEGKPGWRAKHFFVGLDLTIYLLATCLVNILDIARSKEPPTNGYTWTVSLLAVAVLCLFYQTTVHQDWEDENRRGKMRTFMLCGVSNAIGLGLLCGFMKLKVTGAL